jgi:Carboxypeptidase regulatory-like domain
MARDLVMELSAELLECLSMVVALSPGQLGGYVFDPSGAAIPNAHLQIQNLTTGVSWNAVSTADGSWRIGGLPSGTYQVTATAQGFQNSVLNLPYDAANPRAYRVGLNLGSVTSTVTVEASAVELNTESSQVWTKDRKHKKESFAALPPPPTASANVFNLQQRVAGVLPVAVDVPRAGTSYRFIRPLVVNEETKLNFTYKSKK